MPSTIRQQTRTCKLVEIYPRVELYRMYSNPCRYLSSVWWLLARCQAKWVYNRAYRSWMIAWTCMKQYRIVLGNYASCYIELHCDYYDWISRDRRWSALLIEPRRLAMKVSWENCEIPEFTRSREDPDRSGRFLELVKRHGDWPGRQGISQVLLLIYIYIYFTNNQNNILINIIIIKDVYHGNCIKIADNLSIIPLFLFFYTFYLLFPDLRPTNIIYSDQ